MGSVVKSFFTRLVFRLFSIHVQENKGITQYTTSNYKHYITQGYQMTYSILDAVYQLCELNVILTQLQCSAAFLNNDLYESNILSSPNCPCGVPREDAYHFFFECNKHTDIRKDLFICVNRFGIKIDLAGGIQNLTYENNCLIFKEACKIIRRSKRSLVP